MIRVLNESSLVAIFLAEMHARACELAIAQGLTQSELSAPHITVNITITDFEVNVPPFRCNAFVRR